MEGLHFTVAGLEYTYPGATDLDYFELRAAVAHTCSKLTLSVEQLLVAG